MSLILLKDDTFRQITDFIYEHSGIYLPAAKKYLVENRLQKVLEENNYKGFEEFLYAVKFSPGGKESTRLFDAITTNETYFFREPMQFDVFIDHIVPRVLEDKKSIGDVKVWSAASSTGEEPFTVSMIMRERRPNVRADISGSDISTKVLDSARTGVFSSYSIRNVPEAYMKKYFMQRGQEYLLSASVKASVKFKNINLIDRRQMSEMRNVDVIFCRNVLIYFDEKAKQKVVSGLYDALRPGGFLIIGSSESLHNVTRAFKPVTINKVVVYHKA